MSTLMTKPFATATFCYTRASVVEHALVTQWLFILLLARASLVVTFPLPLVASILWCLSRFQMLAFMLSPSDSICFSGGGTDGGSDGESGLDLLRDEDGNSDESSGY
ncbi:hypothetical protein Tco_0615629 [Tanacetum coccineum]